MSIVNSVQVPKMRRTRIKGRSHTFDFNCRIGELIPVMAEECVAGDIVKYGVESVIQFPALKKPLFSDGWKVEFFYFFNPYRILWKDWVNFLPVHSSYNPDGTNSTPSLPRYTYRYSTSSLLGKTVDSCCTYEYSFDGAETKFYNKFSVADYLNACTPGVNPSGKSVANDLHQRAYLADYEYFFRDENLDESVWNFDEANPIVIYEKQSGANYVRFTAGIQSRAWKKDYFTGGLPWIQKGVAPALPLYGSGSTTIPVYNDLYESGSHTYTPLKFGDGREFSESGVSGTPYYNSNGIPNTSDDLFVGMPIVKDVANQPAPDEGAKLVARGSVDLSRATSADISELWTSMQIQKFLIRNAQVGTRYNEFLLAHYGISPRDETLQRPVFLGSTSQPVFVSEVVQNSETSTTPQGTKTAKAISAGADYVGKYHVKEPGVLMCIMCISPKAVYTQGVDRFYLKDSPYDFYNRLFENLTDQPTYNAEIFLQNGDGTGDTENRGTFNFMPRYCEYKIARDRVAGDLRDSLSMWHTGRIFASRPSFNSAFLHQGYSSLDRIFAIGGDTRNCVCHVVNKLDMLRPMSYLNMVGARI